MDNTLLMRQWYWDTCPDKVKKLIEPYVNPNNGGYCDCPIWIKIYKYCPNVEEIEMENTSHEPMCSFEIHTVKFSPDELLLDTGSSPSDLFTVVLAYM
jgi:hypothetical protein